MNPVDLKLYLVTDSGYYDEKRFLDMVEKACRGGVTLLQLREKNRGGREYLRLAQAVKEITDPAGCLSSSTTGWTWPWPAARRASTWVRPTCLFGRPGS